MMVDTCKNCGGSLGLHHYQTEQCPVCGVEALFGRVREWKTSTFEPLPLTPPERLARDMTLREHFAAMAMQGFATKESSQTRSGAGAAALYAVRYADALIAELQKEDK
jgi:hypothetical protein